MLVALFVAAMAAATAIADDRVGVQPFNGVFVLRRPSDGGGFLNQTQSAEIFLQNGCPHSADQILTRRVAGHSYSTPIWPSVHNLHCGVVVRLASERISLDRPYVDILIVRDPAWLSVIRSRLCVTIQLTNNAGASVAGSCILHEREPKSCLIRQIIPFTWFQVQSSETQRPVEHLVSVAYSVRMECGAPEYSLFNQRLRLLASTQKMVVFASGTQTDGELSLHSRPNLTFTAEAAASIVVHYKQNADFNETDLSSHSLRVWVRLDPNYEIVSASALEPKRWRMRVESSVGAERFVAFSLTPNDVDELEPGWSNYLFAMLIRMRSTPTEPLNSTSPPLIVVHWAARQDLEAADDDSADGSAEATQPPTGAEGRIARRLLHTTDAPYVVVPITKTTDIINSAVFTGVQVSAPMRILAVTEAGQWLDVTDQSHCQSIEPRLLKVSPTCTSVYVDGSELRGMANIFVQIQYKAVRSTAHFNVWFPKLPVTVWLADKTLNAVSEWRVSGWRQMSRRRREARQSVCRNRFQQTEVRVLAAFQIVDEESGERSYLSGSRDLLFDVTQIAADRVQSAHPQIVAIRRKDGRVLAAAKAAGETRIVVKAASAAIDYGGAQLTVAEEAVSAVQLIVRAVTDVRFEIRPRDGIPFQYELVTEQRADFTPELQHGSLDITIFYSDGQRELLADVETSAYVLGIYTTGDGSLRIRQQRGSSNVELVALDGRRDGPAESATVLTAEMRGPAVCEEPELPALASGQLRVERRFPTLKATGTPAERENRIQLNITGISVPRAPTLGLETFLLLLLILLLLVLLIHFLSSHSRGLHNGYEKLVMPLLARLSSSGSLSADAEGGVNAASESTTKEWIWLPKSQLDNISVASHFSQRSTLGISNGTTLSTGSSSSASSGDSAANRSVSVSYRGSEISVYLAPQSADVAVNDEQRYKHRPTMSWRSTNGRSSQLTVRQRSGDAASFHDHLNEQCRRASTLTKGRLRRSSDHIAASRQRRVRRPPADSYGFGRPVQRPAPVAAAVKPQIPSYSSFYCNAEWPAAAVAATTSAAAESRPLGAHFYSTRPWAHDSADEEEEDEEGDDPMLSSLDYSPNDEESRSYGGSATRRRGDFEIRETVA